MPRNSAAVHARPGNRPQARVGLVGCGTVGSVVARTLSDRRHPEVRLVRVCARSAQRPRPAWLPGDVEWTSRFDELLAPDVDILVELVGGLSPAREWVARALAAGKSVVTANKQLVAEEGGRLAALAARQRRQLRYGAAVAGGVPVIEAIRGLAGDRLLRIVGVLNGTCNYILSRMEECAVPFEEALCEARALGYAEADSRADVEGWDARAKLAILCAESFGTRIAPSQIRCTSIAGVAPADLAAARASHAAIRQISRAERDPAAPGGLRASVGPELVPLDSALARVRGCDNVVILTGERGGDTLYAGPGAGGDATSVAVISDVLAVAAAHPGGAQ